MKKTPQVFWGEGMFLRPHHLQTADRFRDEQLAREVFRVQPFAWGVQSLDVAPDHRLDDPVDPVLPHHGNRRCTDPAIGLAGAFPQSPHAWPAGRYDATGAGADPRL